MHASLISILTTGAAVLLAVAGFAAPGSTVTVSVVSDAQGRYSFPANRLSAG